MLRKPIRNLEPRCLAVHEYMTMCLYSWIGIESTKGDVMAARLLVKDLDFDRQATAACALRGLVTAQSQGVTTVLAE